MKNFSRSLQVTYGGITRRFHVDVDENRNLDLDMIGLKARIFSLFDIPAVSDVSITYVDDGNDVVNLVHDVDLQEVMVQKMECLKITVLKNERIVRLYSAECRSSTPQKHQTLPDLSVVAESHATKVTPVFDKAGSEGGYSAGSAVISQPVLAGSNNMEENSARDASNKLAFGESSSISRKGIEAGVKYLPKAAAVNSHSSANADTPQKSELSEEVRPLLRQLQKENDDLKDKMEQLLRQIIEGKEVDIGDAPTAPIIDSSREPRLAEDNREAQLQGEIDALNSERELLLEQNKILKEIKSNKAQLLKEIEALSNENEQLLQRNQIAEGSYGGQLDAELVRLQKEIEALCNEKERLLQQNQNAEGSYRGQPDAELVPSEWAAARLLQDEPRGEEEDGSQIMIMPPLNVSDDLNWIQAFVPSLGVLLTNLSIPVWLKTTTRWLLTLIAHLPWRQIFEQAYSFIRLVRNSMSSRLQWLREKLYDVMVDLARRMVPSSRRPQMLCV